MHLHVQTWKLVHVSGVHGHLCASSISGYAFVYFIVQYCIEYNSTVFSFQAQDVCKQVKRSGDVPSIAKKHQVKTMELSAQHKELTNEGLMELEAQRKDD